MLSHRAAKNNPKRVEMTRGTTSTRKGIRQYYGTAVLTLCKFQPKVLIVITETHTKKLQKRMRMERAVASEGVREGRQRGKEYKNLQVKTYPTNTYLCNVV